MRVPSPEKFSVHFNDSVWVRVGETICRKEGIAFNTLCRAENGENVVLLIDTKLILKLYKPRRNGFDRESSALRGAAETGSIAIPKIITAGQFEGFDYLITSRLQGRSMLRKEWLSLDRRVQVRLLTELAQALRVLHSCNLNGIHFDWNRFIKAQIETVIERQMKDGGNPEWIGSLPHYLDRNLELLPKHPTPIFMHGDVHFGNILVHGEGSSLSISGLFDFADSLNGFHEYEFVAPGVLMIQGQGELQREFFRAYRYPESAIDEELRTRLMLLTILYETSGLRRYAERLRPEAVNYSLHQLERAIWNFT